MKEKQREGNRERTCFFPSKHKPTKYQLKAQQLAHKAVYPMILGLFWAIHPALP